MTARRDRPSQVRPRPPSTGRPRQVPPAARHPVAARSVAARTPEPARAMPIAARAALLAAVVLLAGVILTTLTGFLPRAVESAGSALGGLAGSVLATPTPADVPAPAPPPPALVPPDGPYTNKPAVTITGTVPAGIAGRAGYVVRVYVALPDQEPVAVRDVPVGETPSFVVPELPLEKGRNDVSATIVGPGGESDPSAVITYVLDTSKPKVTVTAPQDGATINGDTAQIAGKTQGRSTVVARNEATGTASTATSDGTGSFAVEVPLSAGQNAITLTVTDPAGNVGSAVLTLRRGNGQLTVALGASAYRLSAARLPRDLELRAQVTDPDGRPLEAQTVSFTLSIPGVPAITGDEVTDATGTATFTTTVPAGATAGSGLGTAFVSTAEFGDTSGRVTITITE